MNALRLQITSLPFAMFGLLNAQTPAIPAWMRPFFGESASTTLPVVHRHGVKHNIFIGAYKARLSVTDTTNGITQHLHLSAWQDSTRGIMQLELFPGMPHTTWFADISANMGVVANAIGRKAVVSDLQRVLLVDRLRDPGRLHEFGQVPLEATGAVEELAGQRCPEHLLIEGHDTMRVWTADVTPSPFADGPAWIPLNEGPLQAFRLLFRLGEVVAFKFTLQPLLELEVMEFTSGSLPPPVIDLSRYVLEPVDATGPPRPGR